MAEPPESKLDGRFMSWQHDMSDDGPIFKNVKHQLIDNISSEAYEDPWRKLQFPGFIDHARRLANETIENKSGHNERRIDDAREVLYSIQAIDSLLKPGSPIELSGAPWNHVRMLARACLTLGRSYERMVGRQAEPDAGCGKKTRQGASQGGKRMSKMHLAPNGGWQAAVLQEMDRGFSYSKACEIVGRLVGCSGRTVMKYAPRATLPH